jgi:hypothetical protein
VEIRIDLAGAAQQRLGLFTEVTANSAVERQAGDGG